MMMVSSITLINGLPEYTDGLRIGQWRGKVPIPTDLTLESSEENLQGENKEAFLRFVRSMLQWRPEDRKTAKQLLDDPWLLAPTR